MPRHSIYLLAFLATVGSGAWGTTVTAQVPEAQSAASRARLEALFAGLTPSEEVQIVTRQLFVEQAAFQSLEDGVVQLLAGEASVPIPLSDIRAVSFPSDHQIQGMLWGLGSGILVGSVVGLMVGSFDCNSFEDCGPAERRGTIIGGSALGVLGGLTGFMIGRHSISWKPVFP